MVIEVRYNLSQSSFFLTETRTLTKKTVTELKEKIIDSLNYKDLSTISKIRGSKISINRKYLEKNNLKESDLEKI